MAHNPWVGNSRQTRLPRLLVADDGRHPFEPPNGLDVGLLLRDTEVSVVVEQAAAATTVLAVDLDSIGGLDGDEVAVDFVVERLGVTIILSRRPHLVARVAELGCLGMLHVLALDSTGLSRSLETHPRAVGTGTVVSPGLVVGHLRPDELDKLPRPTLAYGLIDTPEDAFAILPKVDSIVVRATTAQRIAALASPR